MNRLALKIIDRASLESSSASGTCFGNAGFAPSRRTQAQARRSALHYVLVSGLIAATGCAGGGDETHLWGPGDDPAAVVAAESPDTSREMTPIALPPEFRRVTQAVFLDSGRIALLDGTSCTVWIADRSGDGFPLNPSCGAGPGSLSRPSTAAVVQDSLRVVDGGANAVVTFGPDLEEVRRTSIPAAIAGNYLYSAAAWLADSLVLSRMVVAGATLPKELRSLVVVLPLDGSDMVRSVDLVSPSIASQVATPTGMIGPSCSPPFAAGASHQTVYVLNPWAFEVAALTEGQVDEARFFRWKSPDDGPRYFPDQGSPASRVMAAGIACGSDGYVAVQVSSDRPEDSSSGLTYRQELRTYAGEVLHREEYPSAEGIGTWLPLAGMGDEFFLSTRDERYAGYLVRFGR